MSVIERPQNLNTADARLSAIAGQMTLEQGTILQYVKVESLFEEDGYHSFDAWCTDRMQQQHWGVSDLRTVNKYARAGYIVVYLHRYKQYSADVIFSKVGAPATLARLMPKTFSTRWQDGDTLSIDKDEATDLLAVMDSEGDVKACLKARSDQQGAHCQETLADCEPGKLQSAKQQQQQQQQIKGQQHKQQQAEGVHRRQVAQKHQQQGQILPARQMTAQQQPAKAARNDIFDQTATAVSNNRCSIAANIKAKPANDAAANKSQAPQVIPRPKGLLPTLEFDSWHNIAGTYAVGHQRLLAATSMYKSAASTATLAAAARSTDNCLAPCHKIATAPSGAQLHTIVTAPITDFKEYAVSLDNALSDCHQQRTVVMVPVVNISIMGCYLLHLSGYTSLLQQPVPQVLLVSQHLFDGATDEQLFLELQGQIYDSLTAEQSIAMASHELSGFVVLKRATVLVSVPDNCSRLELISLEHIVARLCPTPASGLTDEQMAAFSSSALPACRALLDIGDSLPKKLDSQIKAQCGTRLKHCMSPGVTPVCRFNAVLEVVLRLLASCRPFWKGVKRQEQTRGTSGVFYSDGLRASGGGGPDTRARGWHIGTAEWYHDVGPLYSPRDKPAEREAKLAQVKQWQQAWRECRAPLMSLLYSYLCSMLGTVLPAFQTAVNMHPGMEDVRLQEDVPYHQMQSSLNAHIGVHKDEEDLLGTVIIWVSLAAAAAASIAGSVKRDRKRLAPEPPSPGAAFVLYDLGCVFEVGHLSHLWVRSDKHWHGTIRDYGLPEQATADALLAGTAFANKTDVTREVLKVWHMGGQVTWRRQYDADPPDTLQVIPSHGEP